MTVNDLKEGMYVTYIPRHLKNLPYSMIKEGNVKGIEVGVVTSWNDMYVFVDYGTGNSKATRIEDLIKRD